jgi:hypothetical protein
MTIFFNLDIFCSVLTDFSQASFPLLKGEGLKEARPLRWL